MKNTNLQNETSGFWNSSTSRTIISLTAGAVAGAVTALLLAPQSGAETRRSIADGALRAKGSLTDTIQSGIDKLTSKASSMEEDLLSNNAGSGLGRKQTATRTPNATGEGYSAGSTPGQGKY